MNETQDLTTLSIRMAIFAVIAIIFYFILRGEKTKK